MYVYFHVRFRSQNSHTLKLRGMGLTTGQVILTPSANGPSFPGCPWVSDASTNTQH